MQTYTKLDGGRVVVKTGCIGRLTLIQASVAAILLGPFMWVICQEPLWWCCTAMFLAPFIVDGLRPVHIYYPPEQ